MGEVTKSCKCMMYYDFASLPRGGDNDASRHHGAGVLFPAWLVMISTGALLAFAASLLVVRVAPAATGKGGVRGVDPSIG